MIYKLKRNILITARNLILSVIGFEFHRIQWFHLILRLEKCFTPLKLITLIINE